MENFSKNKKGRPRKYDRILLEGGLAFPEIKTIRGGYNLHYMLEALSLLIDIKKTKNVKNKLHHFIIKKNDDGSFRPYKKTILVELGKVCLFSSEQEALRLADTICKNKLNTEKAVNLIKEFRGLRRKKLDGILKRIVNIINNSLLNKDEILELMKNVNDLVVTEL